MNAIHQVRGGRLVAGLPVLWRFICGDRRAGLVAAILWVAFPVRAWPVDGSNEVRVVDSMRRVSLSPFVEYLADETGARTLGQAMVSDGFRGVHREWPSFGFTRAAVWGRVGIRSAAAHPVDLVLQLHNARSEELDWYVLGPDGVEWHGLGGTQRPPGGGELRTRLPAVPLRLEPGGHRTIYVRARSEAAIQLPFRLWSLEAFAQEQERTGFVYAFFFGYILALVALAVLFAIFARDGGYLIYALSIGLLLLHLLLLSGYYAWLGGPAPAFMAKYGVPVNLQLVLLTMFTYVRRLFELRERMPWADRRLVRPLMLFSVAMLVAVGFVPIRVLIQTSLLQALANGAVVMGLGFVLFFRGVRTALFYILAWAAFWCAVVVSTLQYTGRLSFFMEPEYLMLMGTAVGMTLFFVAMAYRVRVFREDREVACGRALELERQLRLQLDAENRERGNRLRQQMLLIRDLHDGLGGMIANLGLVAEIGRRNAAADPDRTRYGQMVDLASECGAEIRGLMNSLETGAANWPDFIVESREKGERLFGPLGVAFHHAVSGDVEAAPAPDAFAVRSLARVYKEAIVNAARHARAGRVDVDLAFETAAFALTIRDDGQGLDPAAQPGRGLANMRRRVEELGGTFEVVSGPGLRLSIRISLPLQSPGSGMAEPDVDAEHVGHFK